MKLSPKSLIIAVVFVLLILGYYYYLSNMSQKNVTDTDQLTDVEMVVTTDLEHNYPPTPREVIRFYVDIQKCYYNQEYEDADLEKMAGQAEKLFDEDLLAKNPHEQFLTSLKQDVANYKNNGRTLNVTLPASSEVVYRTIDGRDTAYLTCVYYVREGGNYSATNQTFILRKDNAGQWKIYGFLTGGIPALETETETAGT